MKARGGGQAKARRPPAKENVIGRIARAIDAAGRDADLARKSASDPAFRQSVREDRRKTLSRFETVQQALDDRERIAKQRNARGKSGRART